MKNILNTVLKVLLPIAFGIAILWWMYRGFDWEQICNACQTMRWDWMALSLLFGILPQVMRGLRWRLTLRPMGEFPRRRICIDSIFLSYASSLVVPRIGEVTRCGTLRSHDGVSFSRALGTVVTERVVDSVIMLLFTAVAFILQVPMFRYFMEKTGTGFQGFMGRFTHTGYLVTLVCLITVVGLFLWIVWKLKAFQKVKGVVLDLGKGITSLRNVENLPLYLFYSFGIWIGYFLHFWLTFYCFGYTQELSISAALAVFCVGSFAVLVPTPNGAGPWHFAVKTMLVLYGIAENSAIVFALIVHTLQTMLIAVLGIYGWADLNIAGKKKKTMC